MGGDKRLTQRSSSATRFKDVLHGRQKSATPKRGQPGLTARQKGHDRCPYHTAEALLLLNDRALDITVLCHRLTAGDCVLSATD